MFDYWQSQLTLARTQKESSRKTRWGSRRDGLPGRLCFTREAWVIPVILWLKDTSPGMDGFNRSGSPRQPIGLVRWARG